MFRIKRFKHTLSSEDKLVATILDLAFEYLLLLEPREGEFKSKFFEAIIPSISYLTITADIELYKKYGQDKRNEIMDEYNKHLIEQFESRYLKKGNKALKEKYTNDLVETIDRLGRAGLGTEQGNDQAIGDNYIDTFALIMSKEVADEPDLSMFTKIYSCHSVTVKTLNKVI